MSRSKMSKEPRLCSASAIKKKYNQLLYYGSMAAGTNGKLLLFQSLKVSLENEVDTRCYKY